MVFSSRISAYSKLALVLLMSMLVMQEISDCNQGYSCSYVQAAPNRKMMENKEVVEMKGSSLHGSKGNIGNTVKWEFRTVPSGPDPLHHNGYDPKNPRTP